MTDYNLATVLREQNRLLEQQCAELGGLKSQLHQITEAINALAAAGAKKSRRAAPRPLTAGPFGGDDDHRDLPIEVRYTNLDGRLARALSQTTVRAPFFRTVDISHRGRCSAEVAQALGDQVAELHRARGGAA